MHDVKTMIRSGTTVLIIEFASTGMEGMLTGEVPCVCRFGSPWLSNRTG